MKRLLILLLCGLSVAAWAQITITRAQYPDSVGYNNPVLTSIDVPVNLGHTGSGNRWNFSAVVPDASPSTVPYVSPDSTPYLRTYNWGTTSAPKFASIAQPGIPFVGSMGGIGGIYSYYRYNGTTALEFLGMSISESAPIPDQAVKNTVTTRVMAFPLTNAQTWTDSVKMMIHIADTTIFTITVPIYARVLIRLQNSVDAYGTLLYPGDSAQALRRVTVSSGRVDAGFTLMSQWISIPNYGTNIPAQTTVMFMAQNLGALVTATSDTAVSTPDFTTALTLIQSSRHYVNAVRESPVRMALPNSLELAAYPNPFNPSTNLTFGSNGSGMARLEMFDAIGRQVGVLYNGPVRAGSKYSTNWSGNTAGTYFVRLTVNGRATTTKMTRLP